MLYLVVDMAAGGEICGACDHQVRLDEASDISDRSATPSSLMSADRQ